MIGENIMKLCRLLITIAVAAPLLFAQVALDGRWEAKFKSNPEAAEQTITFIFKTQGGAVSGTVASPRGGEVKIEQGRISGDTVTFNQTTRNGAGSSTFRYTGRINGDEISFTRIGGIGGGVTQSMTARRVR
jgi:hypothetical protein